MKGQCIKLFLFIVFYTFNGWILSCNNMVMNIKNENDGNLILKWQCGYDNLVQGVPINMGI